MQDSDEKAAMRRRARMAGFVKATLFGGLIFLPVSYTHLYTLVLVFCIVAAMQNKDRFSQLLIIGVAVNFFLYIAVNLSMVMGMAPVVGVPLPLLSYGGSATLGILVPFGLVQSAIVHRPR